MAIEALKEHSTLAELAKKYEVSPTMISHWKANLVKNAGAVFGKQGKSDEDVEKKNQELYAKIGKLEVMLDLPSVSFGVARQRQSELCLCTR